MRFAQTPINQAGAGAGSVRLLSDIKTVSGRRAGLGKGGIFQPAAIPRLISADVHRRLSFKHSNTVNVQAALEGWYAPRNAKRRQGIAVARGVV